MQGNDPFELALAARTDLNVYEHNAHLLYALGKVRISHMAREHLMVTH